MDFTFSLSTFENRSILSSYSLLHSQVGSGDAGSAGSHTGNSFQRSIELSLAPKYAFGLYTHLEYLIHLMSKSVPGRNERNWEAGGRTDVGTGDSCGVYCIAILNVGIKGKRNGVKVGR